MVSKPFQLATDETRPCLYGHFQGCVSVGDKLTHITTLYPNHSEISQDTATATGRQILPQGITESKFSKVKALKLHITGTTFLCQPRAIKSKPSAIAHIARQSLYLLGHVKRPLTGVQFP
jgi:hypothetical protein